MLEPRIMFDGAAVYAASETVKAVEDKAQNNSPNEIDTSLKFWSPSLHNDSRKEIVFIDFIVSYFSFSSLLVL